MSRLPQSGKDVGVWGEVLNRYLLTQHDHQGKHLVKEILSAPSQAGQVIVSNPLAADSIEWKNLDKTDVGLVSVDNTSDADKPISNATQGALDTKLNNNTDGTIAGSLMVDGTSGNKSLTLNSSYIGGDDTSTGTDSTTRLNLQSYQRANWHSYGETIRNYLMRKDAKAMTAWYGPAGLYDSNRDPVGTSWKPWCWTGAHYEANDHGSIHAHWEVEVPDSTGALQGRLEIPFANQTTGVIGLDKTVIKTNLADFNVRCSNGQMLRLSAVAGNNMDIQYSHDSEGGTAYRRWALRATSTAESGSDAGTDFQVIRYSDVGTFLDAAITIERRTGNTGIGTSGPTAKLDVNGDRIRIRTSRTPASATAAGNTGELCWDTGYMYICVATNTWKRVALSTW